MTINKYQGSSKEEAIEKAKEELGKNTVIMNVKEVKPKGLFKVFKNSVFEVTAAMEEKEKFINPLSAINTPLKMHEGINLAADEKISLPPIQSRPEKKSEEKRAAGASGSLGETASQARPLNLSDDMATQTRTRSQYEETSQTRPLQETSAETGSGELERRLENLSSILEKQFANEDEVPAEKTEKSSVTNPESFHFIKMLYRTMLENDVNEVYVNQIMDEAEKVLHNGSNVDYILSNVYQKMILKLGQPKTIQLDGKKPRILFFIGPTGVGKTTTIAKIASKYKVDRGRKVAFLTADTYRIAATEQLRIYANILDAPMNIIYSAEEMNTVIDRVRDYDLVFVDTAGFSHKNDSQCGDMKKLISGLSEEFEKEVYLVLSATTKYKDLLEITDIYKEIAEYKLIFTKLDETTTYGNILNIRMYSGAALSYMTDGQNVPDDICEFDTQRIVKQLLGGR